MKPALTKKEWELPLAEMPKSENLRKYWLWVWSSGRPHAAAALCLHNQLFGFTREDVAVIRDLVDGYKCFMDDRGTVAEDKKILQGADSLADRIEALLPPEEA